MAFPDFQAIFQGFWDNLVALVPNLVAAVILLVVGLVVGKLVGKGIKHLLERVELNKHVSAKSFDLSNLLTVITRWWIYLAFITAAVDTLAIVQLTAWTFRILNFIPNIIGASLIMIAGYILADYVRAGMRSTKEVYASLVGKVLFFFVIYVSVAIALPILGIPAALVNNILLIVIGSVGVGVAIALGLGLRKTVEQLAEKYTKKLKV